MQTIKLHCKKYKEIYINLKNTLLKEYPYPVVEDIMLVTW